MAPVVHTSSGRLRSVPEEGVLVFRGIPYAQPPIGPLRFRPPHKPATWEGIREASTYGPTAMQGGNPVNETRLAHAAMSEDYCWRAAAPSCPKQARPSTPSRRIVPHGRPVGRTPRRQSSGSPLPTTTGTALRSCARPSCTPPTRRRPMRISLPGARRRAGAGWARPTVWRCRSSSADSMTRDSVRSPGKVQRCSGCPGT